MADARFEQTNQSLPVCYTYRLLSEIEPQGGALQPVSADTIAVKTEEQHARHYVDSLILKGLADVGATARLSELVETINLPDLNAQNLRVLLSTNEERFAYTDRRWTTAARRLPEDISLNEAVVRIVRMFGSPSTIRQVATQCEVVFGRPAEYYEGILPRVVAASAELTLAGEYVALNEWVFVGSDESPADALFYNRLSTVDVEPWEKTAKPIDWTKPDAGLLFLRKAKKPVDSRIPGYFAWRALNPYDHYAAMHYDAGKAFAVIAASDEFVLDEDGKWHSASEIEKWLHQGLELAAKLAPTVEVEEAAPLEVKAEDLEQIVELILKNPDSVTSATSLLEAVYEILPGSSTYSEDRTTVISALSADSRVLWVGADRFRRPGGEPQYVHSTPGALEFPPIPEQEEEIDIELTDEGFPPSLRKEVSMALAMDVLDEDPPHGTPGAKERQIRCVMKTHHHEIGTYPLAQIQNGFFATEPKLLEVTLRDPSGRTLEVWVNSETRLIYNLFDWYLEQEHPAGSVFTLTRTDDPAIFDFAWSEENDPLLYVSPSRIEELRDMQLRSDTLSVFEIVSDVMTKYSKGADFLTILTEVNLVRRTKRRMVASVLSGYHCFFLRSGSSVWHYDAKKLDQGFNKNKKKFIKQVIALPIPDEEE